MNDEPKRRTVDPRKNRVALYFTDDEIAYLTKLADAEHLTVSTFARASLMKAKKA